MPTLEAGRDDGEEHDEEEEDLGPCVCPHALTGLPPGHFGTECVPYDCAKCERDYQDYLSGPGDW